MNSIPLSKFRFYTWKEFDVDAEKIARAIPCWNQCFKQVYGPPRGGVTMAAFLSHRLELEYLVRRPSIRDCDRRGEILIVDDIADTGNTLRWYHNKGFLICTLFKHPQCSFSPSIWIREKDDRWVIFPWEDKEKEMAHALKVMNLA